MEVLRKIDPLARRSRSPSTENAAPLRLIVADDDADLRCCLAAYFRSAGYEVVEAADGAELIQHVARELVDPEHNPRFDVVVTDMCMPRAGGLLVLGALHEIDPQLPCVVISGVADPPSLAEARRLGAVACLRKPVELEELAAVVGRSASRR